jgi:Uma2 family endonuclease
MVAASPSFMSFVEAFVETMPPGSAMHLQDISWEQYERYLREVDEKIHVRLSYDDGRLEIMSLSPEHEGIAGLFPHLIFVLAQECQMRFLSRRSTTMRKQAKAKGTEPDDCYYFKNYPAIAGKKRFDLAVDPPPDLALEIDITSPSLSKFAIYAAIGVPELWRHSGNRMQFYRLDGDAYVEISHSDLFPFLTPDVLLNHLRQGELSDTVAMANEFRDWVRAHKQ